MFVDRVLGGVLLVSGTTIGAGMLALPIETGLAGFFPSLIYLCFFWVFMFLTALMLLEVNLWMDREANLISMAQKTLGPWGQLCSWFIYLFLLYSLTTAYLAAGAPLFLNSCEVFFSVDLPSWVAPFPFLMIFGLFVYMGTHAVDVLNRFLIFALFFVFVFLVACLLPLVKIDNLLHTDYLQLPRSSSFMVISFGYHIIIPSLRTYLSSDVKKIRQSIFWGSMIPIIVYIMWLYVTLGVIPAFGYQGIEGLIKSEDPLISMVSRLQMIVNSPYLVFGVNALTFFVLVTSFLGVSLSLLDFLSDGLKIKQNVSGKLMVTCLTFLPPLCFSLTGTNVFIAALDFGGAFGVAILLGLLPPLMVWRGRYVLGLEGNYRLTGGKIPLTFAMAVSCLVILHTIWEKFI